jgi:hypothetical protein
VGKQPAQVVIPKIKMSPLSGEFPGHGQGEANESTTALNSKDRPGFKKAMKLNVETHRDMEKRDGTE